MLNIMVKLLVLFSLLFTAPLLSNDKLSDLIKLVDSEIRELKRLNKNIRGKNPNILFRIIEAYFERGRLKLDYENNKFLSIEPSKRFRINKKKFHASSRRDFITAKKYSFFVLKKFRNFRKKSYIYSILAHISIELNEHKNVVKYLNVARKHSRSKKDTERANSVKANYYFNKKRYKKAIPIYELLIKNRSNKWWTKDAYNLAWSYFYIKKNIL